MAEYIDREAAKKLIDNACAECREACEEFDGFYADCNQCLLHGVKNKLPHLPAADVRPVVRGKWLEDWETGCSECSVCHDGFLWEDFKGVADWKYCPSCGADMREEQT